MFDGLYARLFLEGRIEDNLEIVLSPMSPLESAEFRNGPGLPLHLNLRETKECSDVRVRYRDDDDDISKLEGIHERIRSGLGFIPSSALEFSTRFNTGSINYDVVKALHDSGKFFLENGISSYSIISRAGVQNFIPFLGFSTENNEFINYFDMIEPGFLSKDYYFMFAIVDRLMAVK